MGPSLTLGLVSDTAAAAGVPIPWDTVLEQGGSPAISHAGGIVTLLGGRAYLIQLTVGMSASSGADRDVAVFDRTTSGGVFIPGMRCRAVAVSSASDISGVESRSRIYRPPTNVDIDARWVVATGATTVANFSSLTVIDMGLSL